MSTFSNPSSPCSTFAQQLGNGTVNSTLCEDCWVHIGESMGVTAAGQFMEVCNKLPPDGDYGCASGEGEDASSE